MAKQVAKTYGEALFEIAMEEGRPNIFLEEVEAISAVLKQNPEFDKLLKHPKISKQEKQQVVKTVFEGRVSGEMLGFLELVVVKERYGELPAIFKYFVDRMKEEKKIGVAYVTTAVELSETRKAAVYAKLLETTPYRTLEIHYGVEAGLIGGMIIRIGDRVVDSSIANKLAEMKKDLLQIMV